MSQWLVLFALMWAVCGAAPSASDVAKPNDAGPESARGEWEIVFAEGTSDKQYATELDYFKIEIGAVSRDGKVDYVSKVSARKPDRRLGDLATDRRWRVGWKKGTLQAADRRLLNKAGVNWKDKELLHFFPDAIGSRLAMLARAYAKREPSEIKRTRFEVRPLTKQEGYEFVVVEQDPPKPTGSAGASRNVPADDR